MAYLSACKRRDVLFLSLNSSSQYILFGSALERKLVRGVLRFRGWSSTPAARRDKRIDTGCRVSGFDGTPHRRGGFALVSGDAQARAAVGDAIFSSSAHRVRLGTPPHLRSG